MLIKSLNLTSECNHRRILSFMRPQESLQEQKPNLVS